MKVVTKSVLREVRYREGDDRYPGAWFVDVVPLDCRSGFSLKFSEKPQDISPGVYIIEFDADSVGGGRGFFSSTAYL
jgi:hypothetical protein